MGSVLKPFQNLLDPGSFQVPIGRLAIDWTHPLANGLIGCWVPGVMWGIDLVGNAHLAASNTAKTNLSSEGVGYWSQNSGLYNGSPSSYVMSWNSASLYWRGQLPASDPGTIPSFATVRSQNIRDAISIRSLADITNVGAGSSNGTTALTAGGVNLTSYLNKVISMGATTSVGDFLKFYLNGVFQTQAAQTSAPTLADSAIEIGSWNAPTSRVGVNITTCMYYWKDRVLTASEMAWLNVAPYDFLIPQEEEMPVIFSPPPPSAAILFARSSL
jgi:hypothetical protein